MLKVAYLLLFIVLFSIILFALNRAQRNYGLSSKQRTKWMIRLPLIAGSWFFIQYLIVQSGFYHNLSLPPRIPLLMILPLFLFTGIFLYRNRNHGILQHLPLTAPITYQSFRAFIEVLFYLTFVAGILPVQVTFEGYNYDVLLGLSALPIGWYASRPNPNKRLLIAWNILGIAVVAFAAFTFITSFYFPQLWGYSANDILGFAEFPFLLLPTFFMPSAIFMHVVSIVQLSQRQQ